ECLVDGRQLGEDGLAVRPFLHHPDHAGQVAVGALHASDDRLDLSGFELHQFSSVSRVRAAVSRSRASPATSRRALPAASAPANEIMASGSKASTTVVFSSMPRTTTLQGSSAAIDGS